MKAAKIYEKQTFHICVLTIQIRLDDYQICQLDHRSVNESIWLRFFPWVFREEKQMQYFQFSWIKIRLSLLLDKTSDGTLDGAAFLFLNKSEFDATDLPFDESFFLSPWNSFQSFLVDLLWSRSVQRRRSSALELHWKSSKRSFSGQQPHRMQSRKPHCRMQRVHYRSWLS